MAEVGAAAEQPFGGPLPDVADDVVQTRARSARTHRPAPSPPVRSGTPLGTSSRARRPLVAPRVAARHAGTGEPLPRRVGRQRHARPGAERQRVGVRHVDDRMVGAGKGSRPVRRARERAEGPLATKARASARVASKTSGSRPAKTDRPAGTLGLRDVSGGSTTSRTRSARRRAHQAIASSRRFAATSSGSSRITISAPRAARTARSHRSSADSPGPWPRVQPLRVAARALLDRRVDEHLHERQPRRLVQPPRVQPVLAEGGDERDDATAPASANSRATCADAADVLRPRRRVEAEVARQPVAQVVAIER